MALAAASNVVDGSAVYGVHATKCGDNLRIYMACGSVITVDG